MLPTTFVRLVSKVLAGFEDFTRAFIDDIGIYSNIWAEHLNICWQSLWH